MLPCHHRLVLLLLLVAVMAAACTGTPAAEQARNVGGDRCVFNQAYQENYQEDVAADLTSLAEDCYVLLDTSTAIPVAAIPELKKLGNSVGCYVSIGTGEDWRSDFEQLQPFLVNNEWEQWGGEYFVDDIAGALPIMKKRIDLFASQRCEWVEFDNMDWGDDDEYRSSYGLTVSNIESQEYGNELCQHVHSLDMLCMAKNVRFSPNIFDGATFESFPDDIDWWAHSHLQMFLDEEKLVVVVHYDETDCAAAEADYEELYGPGISFLCESRSLRAYLHE